ncbi:hypothetical protein C8T65DRAFT_698171 [Cerioporus squamosus]|nr:hypothetical protein C8T65DRAFT_698171 [Cerioporus squamosus]
MGANIEDGLRAVKKGLKCPKITPFVRIQILWRATCHAGECGLRILQLAREDDMAARAEGTAFLTSAWEDAKTFISEAPPDTRHMLGMIGCEDLREVDPARRKIKTSRDFMNFVGHSVKRTQLNLTRELLDRRGSTGEAPRASSSLSDDDVSDWLGNVSIDNDEHADHDQHACDVRGAVIRAPMWRLWEDEILRWWMSEIPLGRPQKRVQASGWVIGRFGAQVDNE